ncbi:MAG: GNAT family N-acetyltransferase [Chloroflexota bacterium]|nr:GNAT family N-acetyltransferase [Chloroflexota bacterium]
MTTATTGLRFRTYVGEQDVPAITRVVNAEAADFGVEEVRSDEATAAWFGHPTDQFDARRDVVLGELGGTVVAAGGMDWVDTRDGEYRLFRLWGAVDPAARGRGIGTALLRELEERARQMAAGQSFDRRPVFGSFAAVGRLEEAFLRDAGYEPARWFFDMVRHDLEGVDIAPLPEGIELRPVTPDEHETIWRANREAFRDHWGGSDESLDAMQRVLDDPDTDTSLWLIAWDGDEVAAGVWNAIRGVENEALGLRRGWLESVFTRRPWRKRGLARALITRSLELLRERGMTSAALGVDADNPSGALGLYESTGFEIHDRFIEMRRPMEEVTR